MKVKNLATLFLLGISFIGGIQSVGAMQQKDEDTTQDSNKNQGMQIETFTADVHECKEGHATLADYFDDHKDNIKDAVLDSVISRYLLPLFVQEEEGTFVVNKDIFKESSLQNLNFILEDVLDNLKYIMNKVDNNDDKSIFITTFKNFTSVKKGENFKKFIESFKDINKNDTSNQVPSFNLGNQDDIVTISILNNPKKGEKGIRVPTFKSFFENFNQISNFTKSKANSIFIPVKEDNLPVKKNMAIRTLNNADKKEDKKPVVNKVVDKKEDKKPVLSDLDKYKKDIENLKQKNLEFSNKFDDLTQENETLKVENNSLFNDINVLTAEMDSVVVDRNNLKEENKKLLKKIRILESENGKKKPIRAEKEVPSTKKTTSFYTFYNDSNDVNNESDKEQSMQPATYSRQLKTLEKSVKSSEDEAPNKLHGTLKDGGFVKDDANKVNVVKCQNGQVQLNYTLDGISKKVAFSKYDSNTVDSLFKKVAGNEDCAKLLNHVHLSLKEAFDEKNVKLAAKK